MTTAFLYGDPVWVEVHGGPRRATFLRVHKGRYKVRMTAGTVRTLDKSLVTFRYEKGESER